MLECVSVDGVREHQAAFQAIADANGGTRAAGTPGYDASVDGYVIDTLEAAGWSVETDQFDFTVAQPIRQLTPIVATHATGGVTGSALGTVTAAVTPIDINLDSSAVNTSGCAWSIHRSRGRGAAHSGPGRRQRLRGVRRRPDRADPAGRLQLRPQGRKRPDRGAAAIILFNQGDTPARSVTLTNITAVPPAGSAFTTINVPVVARLRRRCR